MLKDQNWKPIHGGKKGRNVVAYSRLNQTDRLSNFDKKSRIR